MAFAAEKMASAAEKMKQQSSDATGQGTPSNGAIHTNEWEQRTGKDSFNSADSTGETVASPPKKKSIRTILIGVGVAVFLLFVIIAIFSGDAVDTVKNSNLDDYPEMTVGDACDTRFTSGKWTSEEREGITYVIFRGNDPDTISDWEIEFKVLDNQFRVESITVDGIYYSDNLSISALIDYIYTGNYDLLIGYAFLDALLS